MYELHIVSKNKAETKLNRNNKLIVSKKYIYTFIINVNGWGPNGAEFCFKKIVYLYNMAINKRAVLVYLLYNVDRGILYI